MNQFDISNEIKEWLTSGDPSIEYLVYRDLLFNDLLVQSDSFTDAQHCLNQKRNRMLATGWGHDYLSKRNTKTDDYPDHWGRGFYQTKWISSHYTLLELKNIGCPPTTEILITINKILDEKKGSDGGIDPHVGNGLSDTCINGMFLNYASYYGVKEKKLESLIDCIILDVMGDGGFNCRRNRSGAVHSSLHSTLSILEGIETYIQNGYRYRIKELSRIKDHAIEFILIHRLYKSDKTGKIIHKGMTMLSYPSRWKYDILRCLVYFVDAKVPYDQRMKDALELVLSKKRKDDKWPVQAKHPGEVYFDMEKTGQASRMNTYRVLKVLKFYGEFL